ncbi:MAG: methyltransferase [Thermoanaerobaculia bacterium]|nr:methyltransferase [Thermoanaerobaculia bacterium]
MSLSFETIDRLANGYRRSQILLTAIRLGVFEALEPEGAELEELAARLGTDGRGTRILCDALTALEVLEKTGTRYRNTPVARERLIPDAPGSKVAMFRHGARLYERWAKLLDSVRTGEPVPDEVIDPRLESGSRAFAEAMEEIGRESAEKVADAVDFSGVSRLLDLGGGPGAYALELARRHPELEAVVFDRPETVEVASERIREAGLEDRVGVRGGDAFADDLGGPWDFVLASNLIHIYSPEENRRLIDRTAATLAPGGRLCVKDFLLDPGRTTPPGSALFAVNMLVSSEGGDCYTVDQVGSWMREAGLTPGDPIRLTERSRLLIGTRE